MQLTDRLYASLQMSEMFFPRCEDEGYLVAAAEKAADLGFYSALETGVFLQKQHRDAFRRVCEKNGLVMTQWSSIVNANEKLNLSSLDAAERRRSVERVVELAYMAGDGGAQNFSILSGAYPGDEHKEEGLTAFTESVHQIYDAIKTFPGLNLLIEPLDRYVHKKQMIGPILETAPWMKQMKKECPRLYMVYDTSHVALGGEDLLVGLKHANSLISILHLCNADLDPTSALYGDFHLLPTQEGYLTPRRAADILERLTELGGARELPRLYVSVEAHSHTEDTMWANEEICRRFLQKAAAYLK